MGIKPDHWIRRMAKEHDMIEPFENGSVRKGVVSFGNSSYGYDIRVSDEFKVFCPTVRVRRLNDFEKGYLAAIIDGEGHIGRHNSSRVNGTWQITIGNTNLQLLENVQNMVGVGQIYPVKKKAKPHHADAWMYKITRMADVQHLLGQIYLHLIEKRKAALQALDSKSVASQIIDPKNFDEDMVEIVKGDCIIPPNSFALSRTIERFKIPRDVLVICLGKSTYARCGLIVNVTPLEPEWEGYLTLEVSNTTPLPAKVYANEGIAQLLFLGGDGECEVSYADKKGKYQGQVGVVLPRIEK